LACSLGLDKIFWRGGASANLTSIFSNVARKRVTNLLQKVIVYILARGRQCESEKANVGVACADYSAFLK
jgi:hypothetical protein